WTEMAIRSAQAVVELERRGLKTRDILTDASIRNAMAVHAAFGGSTNLLLHVPAIAHAAGLRRPTVEDWIDVNRRTPRLVDVLPNGPTHHPTVRVFLAGGVPEVMLHLRTLGLLDARAASPRREQSRALLQALDRINPADVILPPASAKERGLTGTMIFPVGN